MTSCRLRNPFGWITETTDRDSSFHEHLGHVVFVEPELANPLAPGGEYYLMFELGTHRGISLGLAGGPDSPAPIVSDEPVDKKQLIKPSNSYNSQHQLYEYS